MSSSEFEEIQNAFEEIEYFIWENLYEKTLYREFRKLLKILRRFKKPIKDAVPRTCSLPHFPMMDRILGELYFMSYFDSEYVLERFISLQITLGEILEYRRISKATILEAENYADLVEFSASEYCKFCKVKAGYDVEGNFSCKHWY